jgi:mRNA interferase MazF
VRRGEIWTAAGGGDYADKPRPVLVVQNDQFDATQSVTVCGFTTDSDEMSLFRVRVEPDDQNHLERPCYAMLDKIYTVRRTRLGYLVGSLPHATMLDVDRAIILFLGVGL